MILLTARALLAALECASSDETRPILNGALLQPDGSLVATDGYRLVHIPPSGGNAAEFPSQPGLTPYEIPAAGVIIPAQAMKAAADALKKVKSQYLPILGYTALMQNANGQPGFVVTNLDTTNHLTFRPLEGPYPNYPQVIPGPSEDDRFVTLGSSQLKALVKVAETITARTAKGNPIAITIRVPKNPITAHTAYIHEHENQAYMLIMPLRGKETIADDMEDYRVSRLAGKTTKQIKNQKLREYIAGNLLRSKLARANSMFSSYLAAEQRARDRGVQLEFATGGTVEIPDTVPPEGCVLPNGVIVAPFKFAPIIPDVLPMQVIADPTDRRVYDAIVSPPAAPVVASPAGKFGPPASLVALVRGQQAATQVAN